MVEHKIFIRPIQRKDLSPGMIGYSDFINYYGPILWKRFEKFINEGVVSHDSRLPVMKVKFYHNNKSDQPSENIHCRTRKKLIVETAERHEYQVQNKFEIKEKTKKVIKKIKGGRTDAIIVEDAKKSTSEDDWSVEYSKTGQFDLLSIETETICEFQSELPIIGLEMAESHDANVQTDDFHDLKENPTPQNTRLIIELESEIASLRTKNKELELKDGEDQKRSVIIDQLLYKNEVLTNRSKRMAIANQLLSTTQKKIIDDLKRGLRIEDMVLSEMYQRHLELIATRFDSEVVYGGVKKKIVQVSWEPDEDEMIDRYNDDNFEPDLDYDF